jgi:hypothetical protein
MALNRARSVAVLLRRFFLHMLGIDLELSLFGDTELGVRGGWFAEQES